MCIICNAQNYAGYDKADDFLRKFEAAGKAMRAAEKAMIDAVPYMHESTRSRYKSFHKKLVRMRRDWNRLNEQREERVDHQNRE